MIIFDAHCDTASRMLDEGKNLLENDLHIDLKRLSKNDSMQVFAAFISPEYKDNAMMRAESIIENFCIEAKKNNVMICKSYHELISKSRKVKALLSLEGGEPIEDLSDIDYLKSLGIMMIAPTWNYKNKIACGVLEKEDSGLSEFGKKVIEKMNREGILIDVSHLSEKSFWDVCKISKKPVCASHSNSKTVTDNPRNLTDEQFMRIRDMNGCVGINLYPPFMGDDLSCAIDHIRHFINLGGEDNIGIGCDFDGVDSLPPGISGCEDMEKLIKLIPYSLELREKIAYKNFLRVIYAQNC